MAGATLSIGSVGRGCAARTCVGRARRSWAALVVVDKDGGEAAYNELGVGFCDRRLKARVLPGSITKAESHSRKGTAWFWATLRSALPFGCGFAHRETSCGPKGFEWKGSAKENAVGGRAVGGGEERRNEQGTSGRLGARAAQP